MQACREYVDNKGAASQKPPSVRRETSSADSRQDVSERDVSAWRLCARRTSAAPSTFDNESACSPAGRAATTAASDDA